VTPCKLISIFCLSINMTNFCFKEIFLVTCLVFYHSSEVNPQSTKQKKKENWLTWDNTPFCGGLPI